MRTSLGLFVLLSVACSSDKAYIGDRNQNLDGGGGSSGVGGVGGTSGAGGTAGTGSGGTGGTGSGATGGSGGTAGTAGSGGTAGTAGSGGTAGTGGSGGTSTCPPVFMNCEPEYPGSFACYCEQGELYHPIGCTTTKQQLFDRWAQLTLVEYAGCGLSVILVPASLDGDQRYVFDASGKFVGTRVTSDHGPPCAAGETVGAECVISNCTQKTPDSPPCPQ